MQAARVAWHVILNLPRPLLAAMFVGWALSALPTQAPLPLLLCLSPGASISPATALTLNPPAVLAILGMLLAMMPPLLAQPLAFLWRRSLTRRRKRATALFITGYAAIWFAATIILSAAGIALAAFAGTASAVWIASVLLAILWQIAPFKQICLNRCHRQPRLTAFGLAADADALNYGIMHGIWCVGTCWALMLLPLAAGAWHLPVMAAVTFIILNERSRAPRPPRSISMPQTSSIHRPNWSPSARTSP